MAAQSAEPAGRPADGNTQLECRLCLDAHSEDAEERLVFPCNCSSPLHVSCLRRWQEVQVRQAVEERRSRDEAYARVCTCEVCGAQLVLEGSRKRPFASRAICRAHGGFGKVALRRIPTISRASRNFSEVSASEGQELEILEQDATGEFFRVKAVGAARYREEGSVAVAEGWIRGTYLEWPEESRELAENFLPEPRMPPAYAPRPAEEEMAEVAVNDVQEEGGDDDEDGEEEGEEEQYHTPDHSESSTDEQENAS